MRTNSDLTVYNKSVDPLSRGEVWTRHQVAGIAWENCKAANVIRSGLLDADKVIVYVPAARGMDYLSPLAWQALFNKNGKWTLQVGDVIVRGLVDDEISPDFTISDLKHKYDDVLTIRSVDTMDSGSISLRHWQIGAA